jgi:hypothetical protein
MKPIEPSDAQNLFTAVADMDDEDWYWATNEALWQQIAQGRREGPETRTSHEEVKRMFGVK